MVKGVCVAALLTLAAGCGVPAPPDVPALERQAKAGQAGAVADLVELLGGSRPAESRLAAYQSLLAVGAPGAQKVRAACRDSDPTRREHALALAGNLKFDGAYDEAVRALADPRFPRRYVAAWTLGQLGDPRAAAPLVGALAGEGGETGREAARALIKLGTPAVAPLLAVLPAMKGDAKRAAVRVLGDLRAPEALEPLAVALGDPAVRADAAWALGTLGLPEGARSLVPLLADADWRVRLEGCRSLGLLEATESDGALDKLRTTDPVPAVREWAARSLALLRGKPQTFPNARGVLVQPENLYR